MPGRAHLDRPHATLVLLDGQNVFGDHGSYAGGWHAHEAIDSLGPAFWPTVVLGVPNDGLQRMREYGSQARDFLAALIRALPPFCRAGPCFIGGSSMGGLAALQAWIHHPEVFDGALVMSPSLWYGHRAVLHHIQRGDWPIPRGRLYLDVGARERGRMLADAAELAATLAHLGPDRLLWRPDARGTHHERHWRRRLPKALRFLLRKPR